MNIQALQSPSFYSKTSYTNQIKSSEKNKISDIILASKNDITSYHINFYQQTLSKSKTNFNDQATFSGFTYPFIDDSKNLEHINFHLSWISSEKEIEPFSLEGYWGIEKTASRIADFVIKGAGDDLQKIKAGRDGILKGFREAEKIWGGSLPDISYQTIDKALEAVDEQIDNLDGSTIETFA